jgi:hypothetical protein
MRHQYSEEDKARMAALDKRATKVGYGVHVPRNERDWLFFNIIDRRKLEDHPYNECIVRPPSACDLDTVEEFIAQKEREAAGGGA